MTGIVAALIGGFVATLVALLNGFVVESYKRHLEGSSVASGLAGELDSYSDAVPFLREILEGSMRNRIVAGQRGSLYFRPFDRPKDLFYESAVAKLGVLPVHLVANVVYVYGNIGAFRQAFTVLMNESKSMTDDELFVRIDAASRAIDRVMNRGPATLAELKIRAAKRWHLRELSTSFAF